MKIKKTHVIISLLILFLIISSFSYLNNLKFFIGKSDAEWEEFKPFPYLAETDNESIEFSWIETWGGVGYYNDLFGARRSDYGHEVAVDSNNDVYIVGETGSYGNGMSDFCLIKYNELGEQLWNRTWGGSRYDSAMDVAIDSNDNVYIAGSYHYYVAGESQGGDMAVVKYNSSGQLIWQQTFGGSNDDDCYAITIDSNDNIYLAGARDQQPNDDFLVAKYDSSGTLQWSRVFGGQFPDTCYDVAVDSSGNVYLVGYTNSFGTLGWFNFLIVKYNQFGTQLWYQAWGGSTDDRACDIVIDSSNNIYVAGHTGDPDQITIVKFSSSGTYQWHRAWSGGSYFKDEWYDSGAIVMDDNDLIYITGSSKTLRVYNTSGGLQWTLNYPSSGIGTCSGLVFDSYGNLYFGGKKTTIYNALCLVKYKIQTPIIEILSPISNTLYGITPPEFELTIYEPDLNNTWYSLNSGLNHSFSGSLGFIDQGAWDTCGNGTVNIRFYANNSDGDIAFEEVTVRKDIVDPEIKIDTPNENDLFGENPPEFEVSINETNLDTTWYSLNDGLNYTFLSTTGFIDQAAWDFCGNGTVTIVMWVNDTVGNIAFDEVTVRKDSNPPLLSINSPFNGEIFDGTAPGFSLNAIDPNLHSIWYTIDHGITNVSCGLTGNFNQILWSAHPDGPVTIVFYANDTLGNINSAQISVFKDTIAPKITIIAPFLDQFFTTVAPTFIIEVDEMNIDTLWYTIDGGLTNITFSTNRSIDQTEWIAQMDGSITLGFYANDTFGRVNSSYVNVIKDTVAPTINLITPILNQQFGGISPTFVVEIFDINLDVMWYTFDGGLTNFTFLTNGSIDQTAWAAHSDGNITIHFYANDLAGNEMHDQVAVEKDTVAPMITINSPTLSEFFGTNAPSYDITIDEVNLDAMWYTIDNGITIIFFTELSGAIDQSTWIAAPDGQINIRFYANDTVGNENYMEIAVNKDLVPPVITIISPETDQEYQENPPAYSIGIDEGNLEFYWYTIDGGINNYTITSLTGTINQGAWDAASDGPVTIRFYAKDEAGNVGYNTVTITKSTSSEPIPPGIPGYDLYLLIGALSVISALLIRKRLKS